MKDNTDQHRHRILVVGLSALTDGHCVLYDNLRSYGYQSLILYQTADRMPSPEISFNARKMVKTPLLELLAFIIQMARFRPDVVDLYLHRFSAIGAMGEIGITLAARLFCRNLNLVCTGRELWGWENHNFLKRAAVRLAMWLSGDYLIKAPVMTEVIVKHRLSETSRAYYIHNGVFEGYTGGKFQIAGKKVVLFFNSFRKGRNVDF